MKFTSVSCRRIFRNWNIYQDPVLFLSCLPSIQGIFRLCMLLASQEKDLASSMSPCQIPLCFPQQVCIKPSFKGAQLPDGCFLPRWPTYSLNAGRRRSRRRWIRHHSVGRIAQVSYPRIPNSETQSLQASYKEGTSLLLHATWCCRICYGIHLCRCEPPSSFHPSQGPTHGLIYRILAKSLLLGISLQIQALKEFSILIVYG